MVQIIDISREFDFGGPRSIALIEGVALHTTESADSSTALGTAKWQASSKTGSYHDVIDRSGDIVICNTDDWLTWSAAQTGNRKYVHISFNAKASWSRETWLAHGQMLRSGAKRTALRCKAYGIPVRRITPWDMRSGAKGICTHGDISSAWGETDHTDPGPNFPWDVFINYVNSYMGTNNLQEEEDMGLSETFKSAVNENFTISVKEAIRQTDGNAWTIKNLLLSKMPSKLRPEIKLDVFEFIRNIDLAAYSLYEALITKKYQSRVPGSKVELSLIDYIRNIDRFSFESRQILERVEARLTELEKAGR